MNLLPYSITLHLYNHLKILFLYNIQIIDDELEHVCTFT